MSDRIHNIRTMAELLDVVTRENLDDLKRDLCDWLTLQVEMREHRDVVTLSSTFNWVDDGKAGISKLVIHAEPCWACEGRGSSIHTCGITFAETLPLPEQSE